MSSTTQSRLVFPIVVGAAIFLSTIPAMAFEVSLTDDGVPVHWADPKVDWALNEAFPAGLDPVAYKGAILRSYETWNAVGPEIDLRYTGLTPDATEGYLRGEDNTNIVTWETDSWDYEPEALAITLTTFERKSGELLDADILINGVGFDWSVSGEPGVHDVQNSVTHEVGHLLGLAHSADTEATMFGSAPAGEISKRTLADDDLHALTFLYGTAEASLFPGFPNPTQLPPTEAATASSGFEINSAELHLACSVSQPTAPVSLAPFGLFAGLIALAMILRRRTRRRLDLGVLTGALVLTSLATISPAQATTVQRLSLEQLQSRSTTVAVGHVVASRAAFDGGVVWTTTSIEVEECWQGQCQVGQPLELRTLGGVVGELEQRVSGLHAPRVGERLLLFGRRDGAGRLSPVGLSQGLLRIESFGQRRVAMRDLRGLRLIDTAGGTTAGEESTVMIPLDELRGLVRSAAH